MCPTLTRTDIPADLVPYRLAASLDAEQGRFFDTRRPPFGAA